MNILSPPSLPYHFLNPGHQHLCLDSCSSLPTSLPVGTSVLPTTSNPTFHRTHCRQNCPSKFEQVIPLLRVLLTSSWPCPILNCLSPDLSASSHYPSFCFQNSQAGSYLGSFYLLFLLVGMLCSRPFNVASLSSSFKSTVHLLSSSLRGFPWPSYLNYSPVTLYHTILFPFPPITYCYLELPTLYQELLT